MHRAAWRDLVAPGLASLLALALLLGLGTWQLERKAWKEELIARIWQHVYGLRAELIAATRLAMAEDFDVKGRGKFYEEAGAIRDVIQNHLLQVLSNLLMDALERRNFSDVVFNCYGAFRRYCVYLL